jgi:nucleoside 2-deoxyribosyltransferase
MGSIFEAGYMNSLEKPIVYFCDGLPAGAQFNLMLAASGIKVCRSLAELDEYIKCCVLEDTLLVERYEGEIE